MFVLPPEFTEIMSIFSSAFTNKIYRRSLFLVIGSLLTQGKRTVCGVLRTLNLSQTTRWDLYHRVLSRAKWSPLQCSRYLVRRLVQTFIDRQEPLVFGIDETIERRWGPKIKARGIQRDAVRSSKSHFVKCSGLRWICVMLLTPISWANKTWALPFLTLLAPSKQFYEDRKRSYKKLSDWALQVAILINRWFPDFYCIIVADGSYAIRELLHHAAKLQTWIVRFRLDASLYDFPPVYPAGKRPMGRPPKKGKKQPSLKDRLSDKKTKWEKVIFSEWYDQIDKPMLFCSGTSIWYRSGDPLVKIRWVLLKDPAGKLDPTAICCTDLEMNPVDIIRHFLKRWQVEVTFEEARRHLGVETQRQWSDKSIARTTPALMALFSITTLWGEKLNQQDRLKTFDTAWYKKDKPTFSDVLHTVRERTWKYQFNLRSPKKHDRGKIRTLIYNHLAFMASRAV